MMTLRQRHQPEPQPAPAPACDCAEQLGQLQAEVAAISRAIIALHPRLRQHTPAQGLAGAGVNIADARIIEAAARRQT